MAFAMRLSLNEEIIKRNSIRDLYINGAKNGFSFDVQLSYYRGHYLSDIDILEVYLDGEKMPQEAVTFELNGKEMPIYKLKDAVTEFWSQVALAKIRVIKKGGVPDGVHRIKLELMLRVPYMSIGPDHKYMPLDSGDEVTVMWGEEERK